MKQKIMIIQCVLLCLYPGISQASQYFGLETTKQQALKFNQNYQLAKIELDIAKLQLIHAQADNLITASPVAISEANNRLKIAELNLIASAKQVQLKAEQNFYTVIKLEQQITIAEKILLQAEKHQEITQARLNEGLVTPLDLSQANQGLFLAISQLTTLRNQLQLRKLEFLSTLNLPHDTEFHLNEDDFSFKSLAYDLNGLFNQLIQENFVLVQMRSQLKTAYLEESIAEFSTPLLQKLSALEKQKKEIEYDQAVKNTYLQALELWDNLNTLENTYQLALKKLDLAEQEHQIMLIRFTDGLELETALLNTEIELNKAELEVISILFDYNIAKSQFLNYIGE